MNGTRKAPPRLVLDTNVVLDWLVFHDPRVAPLARLIEAGGVEVVSTEECTAELARVLGYANLALAAERQREILHGYAQAARQLAPTLPAHPLPRCRDVDDQKFLDLAATAGADWLLSRDLALLELARHKSLGFSIATPEKALPRLLTHHAGV